MNSELTNGEVKQLIGKLMQKENGLEDFASNIGMPEDAVRKLFTEILSSPNMSDDAKKFVWNGDDKILQAFVKCTSSTRKNDMADQPVRVRTEKELAKAVESEADTIEIEGDLGNKTIRIKATGKVAWGVCIAALLMRRWACNETNYDREYLSFMGVIYKREVLGCALLSCGKDLCAISAIASSP